MKLSLNDFEPLEIEAIGNGNYLFRWDITHVIPNEQDQEKREHWECKEVEVEYPANEDTILAAVINKLYGHGAENKLINDYNAAQIGLMDASAENKYKEFLQERYRIKALVKAACAKFEI